MRLNPQSWHLNSCQTQITESVVSLSVWCKKNTRTKKNAANVDWKRCDPFLWVLQCGLFSISFLQPPAVLSEQPSCAPPPPLPPSIKSQPLRLSAPKQLAAAQKLRLNRPNGVNKLNNLDAPCVTFHYACIAAPCHRLRAWHVHLECPRGAPRHPSVCAQNADLGGPTMPSVAEESMTSCL